MGQPEYRPYQRADWRYADLQLQHLCVAFVAVGCAGRLRKLNHHRFADRIIQLGGYADNLGVASGRDSLFQREPDRRRLRKLDASVYGRLHSDSGDIQHHGHRNCGQHSPNHDREPDHHGSNFRLLVECIACNNQHFSRQLGQRDHHLISDGWIQFFDCAVGHRAGRPELGVLQSGVDPRSRHFNHDNQRGQEGRPRKSHDHDFRHEWKHNPHDHRDTDCDALTTSSAFRCRAVERQEARTRKGPGFLRVPTLGESDFMRVA